MNFETIISFICDNATWIFSGIGVVVLGILAKFFFKKKSGADLTNLQVAGDLKVGLSYADVKDICQDVFEKNFYKLSEQASKVAIEHAEELFSEYIVSVSQDSSIDTNIFSDPNFQYSFFEAQKAYAKIGDPDLKIRLIDALIERTKETSRNTKQIILDEVIKTLPKLTNDHIDYLSLRFSVIELFFQEVTNLETMKDIIDNTTMIFFNSEMLGKNLPLHLEYCNCIMLQMFWYDGLSEICQRKSIASFLNMDFDNMKKYLSELNPDLKILLDCDGEDNVLGMKLTPVGMVIAILNYNQKVKANLKIEDFI